MGNGNRHPIDQADARLDDNFPACAKSLFRQAGRAIAAGLRRIVTALDVMPQLYPAQNRTQNRARDVSRSLAPVPIAS
jgi:hypothetical protein